MKLFIHFFYYQLETVTRLSQACYKVVVQVVTYYLVTSL